MPPSRVSRLSGTALGNLNIIQNDYFLISTTGPTTATLPNGYEGQQIYILVVSKSGVLGENVVISGDFETGTSATFEQEKDSLTLLWVSNFGWMTVSNQGAVTFA